MLESNSKLFFRTVDYRVFKDGYLFKLADESRRASYKLVFVPFSLYPSVLMLDFLMADLDRGGVIYDDLVAMVKEDLASDNVSELIVLGDSERISDAVIDDTVLNLEKSHKEVELSNLGDSVRTHNKKKLHKVSNISLSRDILKELGGLVQSNIALRVNGDSLVIDRVGSANREYVSGLSIVKDESATRVSTGGAVISNDVGVYLRPYKKSAIINSCDQLGKRSTLANLSVMNSIETASRYSNRNLTLQETILSASRDTTKGFLYTDTKLLDFYVETIPRYLKIMHPEILADRIINNAKMTVTDNLIFTDRNLKNDMYVKDVIEVTRSKLHVMYKDNQMILGKKKAPQHPTHLHFVGTGHRDIRENMYLQAVENAVRDIVAGELFKSCDTLRFERSVVSSLELLKEKLEGYREEQKNKERPAIIERSILTAHRDIFSGVYIEKDKPLGDRIYIVKSFVENNRPQGSRKYDNVLHLSHEQPQGSRDITQNTHLHNTKWDISKAVRDNSSELVKSTSELFDRDTRTGLYLPSDPYRAYREKKIAEINTSDSGIRDTAKDTYKSTSSGFDRVTSKDLLRVSDLNGYNRDNKSSLFLDYSVMYERVKTKLMYIRDAWQDTLINGGEAPFETVWDALLLEDMIFGELLDSPAWVDEYIILGDSNNLRLGAITADFVEGTKKKIQALIDSDILTSSREGDIPGEILSINYDAILTEKESVIVDNSLVGEQESKYAQVQYPDLTADRVTIPKFGWLDELENPLGYIQDREGRIDDNGVQGERGDKLGHIEIGDKQATRPDILDANLSDSTLIGTRDEREANLESSLTAGRGSVSATTTADNILAQKVDHGAEIEQRDFTASKKLGEAVMVDNTSHIGKLWDRESTLAENLKNLLGTAIQRTSELFNKVFMGTKAYGEGYSDNSPGTATRVEHGGISAGDTFNIGEQIHKGGVMESPTVDATRKDSFATVDDTAILGSGKHKDGDLPSGTLIATPALKESSLEEIKLAELKGRLASAIVDFVFAHNEEKETDGLHEIVSAIKQDRAFTLMEHIEGLRESRNGTLEEQLLATPEKLGDVVKGIIATPEKYGIQMDGSVLGQGILHDYNKDLLREGNDVEKWGDGYGFGVPDDYDPLDPFNNYYPYTSDYTSYELAQAVKWSVDGNFEFKNDTDTIKLSTQTSSMAMPDVSGSSYKFSVDFRVDGAKDKAVDIIVRYKNEDNYYVFRINGGDMSGELDMSDNMQLYKVTYGEYIPVGYPMSPHRWVRGTWHRVEVSLLDDGDRLLIKVDDRVQYDMKGY